MINNNDIVFFQGDSITDCGRDRNDHSDLGKGYAMIASGLFGSAYPEKSVTFLNRGVSGNMVTGLKK